MASASQQAVKDLNAKLRLEAMLRPKVNKLFKAMVNAHTRSVAQNGLPLNAQDFQQQWTALLLEHYKIVQAAFVGTVRAYQAKTLKQDEERPTSDELLAGALLMWSERQAPRQAQFITDTNIRNVSEAMAQARESLLEQSNELDDRSMARTSAQVLAVQMSGRVDSIVMTETQSAAETAKIMEAYSLSGINPNTLLGGSMVISTSTKGWHTMGDSKVRKIHADANGQTRLLHEPYDVGGEQLRYPGDSGLGASPKNTANCRCSSIYRI